VVERDQHVGLAVGRVAVGELRRDAIDGVDGVAEVQVGDSGGETSVGVSSVTAPMTPTVSPPASSSWYSGSAGVVVPFRYTLAPSCG
jgi:hypothetical protein